MNDNAWFNEYFKNDLFILFCMYESFVYIHVCALWMFLVPD